MGTLLAVACLAVVALAAAVLGVLLPQRRSRQLERKARDLGLTFARSATPFTGTNVSEFSMLQDGPATVVDNLIEEAMGDWRFLIFDVPLVDDSASLVTTIAAFRSHGLHLPVFQIAAKNVVERMIERTERALGKKLIAISPDHDFASHFFVGCSDPGELRNLLTPAKVAFLRDHAEHYHVESSPDWLFIYRPGGRVEAEDLEHFRNVSGGIASALLSLQPTRFPATA